MKPSLVRDFLATLELPAPFLETVVADLEMMARYKYDDYEMFSPGTRFLEHLYAWAKQFDVAERQAAIEFLRERLVFISQREMQDLARVLYYDLIVPEILEHIIEAERLGPLDYAQAWKRFPDYLRRCLFVGLSDGAKIDFFRRHHIQLSNEQVLPYYRSSADEARRKLRDETDEPSAEFWAVFLIDDFVGSGYTMIRRARDGSFEGSLARVYDHHAEVIDASDHVYACHYIATEQSRAYVRCHVAEYAAYRDKLRLLTPLELRQALAVGRDARDELGAQVLAICDRYYDESFETDNTRKGGGIKLGFGGHALPLVLYSNAPNNSIFTLWLERPPSDASRGFHALFRRVDRHRLR